MLQLIDTLKFIYTHPLNRDDKLGSIVRFIKWQISSRLWDTSFVYDWIGNAKLLISNGMTGATGNVYVGLMEYEDMSFVLHYLQPDDIFFDIGANVGVYTVLASKVKKAKTICVEPLYSTYEKLLDNIQINRLNSRVVAEHIGLSNEKSSLYFTTNRDTMNSVALSTDDDKQEVKVDTLDNLSKRHGIPKIIKIDVEGYEANVLKGAKEILADDNLEIIVLELNGSGVKFGYSDDDIHYDLKNYGFESFTYNPFARELIQLEKYGTHNTVYVKSKAVEGVRQKVKESESFNVNGIEL